MAKLRLKWNSENIAQCGPFEVEVNDYSEDGDGFAPFVSCGSAERELDWTDTLEKSKQACEKELLKLHKEMGKALKVK